MKNETMNLGEAAAVIASAVSTVAGAAGMAFSEEATEKLALAVMAFESADADIAALKEGKAGAGQPMNLRDEDKDPAKGGPEALNKGRDHPSTGKKAS